MSKITEALKCNFAKTVYYNFKLFPFKTALKFPLLISWGIKIKGLKRGVFKINGRIIPLMIKLGYGGSKDLNAVNPKRSYLCIDKGTITFDGKAVFAPHFNIIVKDAELQIGDGFCCNNSCTISCLKGLYFGRDCLLGGEIIIRDSDGHSISYSNKRQNLDDKIVIGDHVWICSKCSILKGFRIGNDSVVAYGSLCTKAIHMEHVLIGGYPAKLIKNINGWEK